MDCARTGAFGATFTLAFARYAFRAVKQLVVNLRHRKQVQGLHRLDDRLLADIGLRRSDITSALGEGLSVDPSEHLAELRCDTIHAPRIAAVPGGIASLERVRAPDAALTMAGKLDLKPC